MTGDEEFEPKLGRMRSAGSCGARKYLHRALAAAMLAGGLRRSGRRRFEGGRIGRGAAIALLLRPREGPSRLRWRRAIVKTRLVRLGAKGIGAARAHLSYIQRDGVQRDGSPGALYSAEEDCADGKAFLGRCDGDRHQFRFIVSAEDSDQYDDLKPLVRRWMERMEQDLGTRLDWVAVNHLDTGHPHSHVILRGKDERGQNLVIARGYIAHGMRERFAELVTLDLGPRSKLELARSLRLEVGAERLTSLDRTLLQDSGIGRVVAAGHRDPAQHALRAGRLKKLEALGLALDLGGGKWKLELNLEERLRAMGERGDIVRTMQRALGARAIERPLADQVVHASAPLDRAVVGRVVGAGLSDELSDRRYLILDAIDGRVHHLDAGEAAEPLTEGSIVRVSPAGLSARGIDRAVAKVAAANGGRYSLEAHLRYDPNASEVFAATHVRRLEAMRRAGLCERLGDGSWAIASNHLERAERHEAQLARRVPVLIETLSPLPIERLADAESATWLDLELAAPAPEPLRDAGFGREVGAALAVRRQWLLGQGFAEERGEGVAFKPGALASLRQREIENVAKEIAAKLGKPFAAAAGRDWVEGILKRRIDLAAGRFALLENSREFTLVPWRAVLEHRLGMEIRGMVRGDGVSWSLSRGRSGPAVE